MWQFEGMLEPLSNTIVNLLDVCVQHVGETKYHMRVKQRARVHCTCNRTDSLWANDPTYVTPSRCLERCPGVEAPVTST